METKTLLDEFRGFNKGGLFDFGHPLLNRIAESFVKSAGVRTYKHTCIHTRMNIYLYTLSAFWPLRNEILQH